MFFFGGSFWVSVSALFFTLFKFFTRILSRIQENKNKISQVKKLDSSSVSLLENNQLVLGCYEAGDEKVKEKSSADEVQDKFTDTSEAESPEFCFKFEFQTETFEKLSPSYRGTTEIVLLDSVSSSITTSKYEFLPEKNPSFFWEKPADLSFNVLELDVYSDQDNATHQNSEKAVLEEKDVEPESSLFLSEKEFTAIDSDSDSNSSTIEKTGDFLGSISISDGFLSDKDLEEASELNPSNDSSSADSEDLEILWEHQDLVEQLKMEMKRVRASGLPTILEEESEESPRIMEDLKPWKIEENSPSNSKNKITELHKFYKSYKERMRKLDILNYQKMYAIGFFQSKDPFSTQRVVSSFFGLVKSKKGEIDPSVKFIAELHTDLEAVYVGQMCLSWEILYWQYEKAVDLWESDHYGVRRYNEVAGEFQQFQVLIQRFLENEKFEGPRVQNYAKKRCFLRNLLQVPVIRGDKGKARTNDALTSDRIVEIMEESIRMFWRFVRADKDANVVHQKSRKGTRITPLEPDDLELLAEVQTSLHKKDKKLKEILRSGNCLLRKFQKNKEDNSDQVMYFFSQVDMKLVARALNMTKVARDQLLWCRSKLSRIDFVNRKIHVEPSFLLFPC